LLTSYSRAALVARLRAAGCVFAEDEADILLSSARTGAELDAMVSSRVRGDPIEHVVGWVEFAGMRIGVEPGVFVPRRRTELLARTASELGAAMPAPVTAVELCCGAGAVAVVIAARLPGVDVYAADIDPVAVACARRNLPAGHVYQGDLYAPLPGSLHGRVDLLVANAPYVPTAELPFMPREAQLHEPAVALDGGADGLDIFRRLVTEAPAWLSPRGSVLVETSVRQAPTACAALREAGLSADVVRSDDLDATVVAGTRRPA